MPHLLHVMLTAFELDDPDFIAPAMLNLSLIAAPVLFVPVALSMGLSAIAGLAIGALVGGALQLLVQLPALGRVNMRPAPRIDFRDAAVRRAIRKQAKTKGYDFAEE